jgi:predicted nuclease of predicted toxin-antitoxin system
LKALVDEMYPPAIAERLRDRGHDVEAVTERPELRGLADIDIFMLAQQERRSIVTENIADFSVIADGYDERGQAHHGLVLVSPGNYQRGDSRTIGRIVVALERLLSESPATGPTSPRHWL